MVVTTLVAAFGTAAWWVETSGLLKIGRRARHQRCQSALDGSIRGFHGEPGLKTLGTQSGFSGDWIEVFKPSDAAALSAGGQATADSVSDGNGQRLRITSASAEAPGDVRIEIPASVLEQLSGKTSTLALTVQSEAGKPTQFSVKCDFASLGECGRHRFTVNEEHSDMLFKVTFKQSLAPNAPGHLVVNSDVTGAGNSLNLFAVRVLPGE